MAKVGTTSGSSLGPSGQRILITDEADKRMSVLFVLRGCFKGIKKSFASVAFHPWLEIAGDRNNVHSRD
jgi:hypothetical protein